MSQSAISNLSMVEIEIGQVGKTPQIRERVIGELGTVRTQGWTSLSARSNAPSPRR